MYRAFSTLSLRILSIAVLVVVGGVVAPHSASAATMPITGWAWSSARDITSGASQPFMGWISMSSQTGEPAYGVSEDTTTGVLSGHAWSSNLGWISFNAIDVSTGCPSGACVSKIDLATQKAVGWARACSAFTSAGACIGDIDSGSGDWNGWISLAGTATDGSDYSITQNADCTWSGSAWGSTNIGWINFGPSGTSPGAKGSPNNPICTSTSPKADLRPTNLRPRSIPGGVAGVFIATIENTGPVDTGSFRSKMHVCPKDDGPCKGELFTMNWKQRLIAFFMPSAYAAAQPIKIQFGATTRLKNSSSDQTKSYLPGKFPVVSIKTEYEMMLCVDSDMVVPENDETNNCGDWLALDVMPPLVDGACSTTRFECTKGTSIDNGGNASDYLWSCQGSGGGITVPCSESKTGTPTVDIDANPKRVKKDDPTTVTWSSSANATSCSVTRSPAASPPVAWWPSALLSKDPGQVDNVTTPTTYSITCLNGLIPSETKSVIVNTVPELDNF